MKSFLLVALMAASGLASAQVGGGSVFDGNDAYRAHNVRFGQVVAVGPAVIEEKSSGNGTAGAIVGGAVGTGLGSLIGNKSGKKLAMLVGGTTGAVVGNKVATAPTKVHGVAYTIRMSDTGKTEVVPQPYVKGEVLAEVGANVKVVQVGGGRSQVIPY